MRRAIGLALATYSAMLATHVLGVSPSPPVASDRAAAIGQLIQHWQVRLLASGLPVEEAKSWSRRNLARFSRFSAERLALAQSAATLDELEVVLAEAPIPEGTHLDVLLATKPGDITMMAMAHSKASPATAPSAYSNLAFTALAPCRIYDSRASQGGAGRWAAGSTNAIKIGPYPGAGGGYATGLGAQGGSATGCGLDALATAGQIAVVMAAVSTTNQGGAGYLTFFPQGAPNPAPNAVSQWYQPGYVQTSFVLIPTDLVASVAASAYTSAATEVVIDVMGYFTALASNGNIRLVQSTANAGNILKGNTRFMHNFGTDNTFIGVNAGNFASSGTENTGIGQRALAEPGSGSHNTATGVRALLLNTSGRENTATGVNALETNTIGNENTAIGSGALLSNTEGINNTAIGRHAAVLNTTGSNNIVIGNGAGSGLTTGDFNIHIAGNGGLDGEGNTIRIGGQNHARAFIGGIRGSTTGSANAVPVLIDSAGQLGTINSSRRYKDGIADMDAASSRLMQLRPVTFHYKSDANPARRALQYGLVAEEVAAVYPSLVAHSADGEVETVMYQFLPAMLLNEYQKQQRMIERQASELAELKRQVARFVEMLAPR